MKKLLLVFVFCLMASAVQAEEITIVATTGQVADTVRRIGGDHVLVTGLMGPGVDPHLYKAKASDVRLLSKADMIFYSGLHLEAKLGDVLEQIARKKPVIAVTDAIPVEQLHVSQINFSQHDPHVWFDLNLWLYAAQAVADALIAYDPSLKEDVLRNFEVYQTELHDTYAQTKALAETLTQEQRVLVTAHDAFEYFGVAYDFKVFGLQGISTEAEAGAKDVIDLAQYIVDHQVKSIFIESSIPVRNIKAVQEAVAAKGWTVTIGGELYSDALGAEGTPEATLFGVINYNMKTIVAALQ